MAKSGVANSESEIVKILLKLDESDLFSLAKTVTQGLKKSRTRDEAIKHIIKYSADMLSILRRKIVTREILFDYLEQQSVKIRLPITKNELIDKILELWNLPRISSNITSENDENDSNPSSNSISSLAKNKKLAVVSEPRSNVSLLAKQFAKWFYSMLNSNEGVGSEHFYPDAKLQIKMYGDGNCDSTVVENDPEEIRNSFLRIKLQHNLFFNLNESEEGIQGRMDPHGLVLVLACGTLHINNTCAGIFEQVFALARDPFCENNWKVKNTEICLRSKSISGPPTLFDSELTSQLLMLPSN